MKRAIPSFFLRHSIPNRGRNFSNTSTGILKTFVWLPAIKTRDSATQEIISREVLSPSQAKQRFAQGLKGVDPWGHAAAQIIVDGVDGGRNEIIEKIQELAVINQVVPLRDASSIRSFQAFLACTLIIINQAGDDNLLRQRSKNGPSVQRQKIS